jgi:acyl carrier protein
MDQQQPLAWTEERVIGIIRTLAEEEELPKHLRTAPINGADTVETLGLDSIGAVALIDRLEAEGGVPLPDDFLGFEDSVADIVQRLNTLA